ncbi:amidohydrolase [Congregibacter variabilis]|uniref:Amidohydrolase n=1 Tax=Congregibacter variabilis TaxID=3081200 RepID=A0ABZ0I049_9GAMM|nr:amidohydrolase [Congregibacter sp. IMCC43200]
MALFAKPILRMTAVLAALLPVITIAADWQTEVDQRVQNVNDKVIELRHHFHAYPELSNQEFKTAQKIAAELSALGFDEVQTGVAGTGVIGILKGSKPGPTVALRADMDALPVTEKTGLPFASTVTTEWRGTETGVMHACGHDAHMAILLGAAEVLAGIRDQIPGKIKFIFQPAEEGPGGADVMVAEGVLRDTGAIFGLHVFPAPAGMIMYKPEGFMAAADTFSVVVKGVQTHGSMPWKGVDPIAVSAQIINNLQTIVSRQIDVSKAPAVVSIGSINGGNRNNIIPEEVVMSGTIRTLDMAMRADVHERIKRTVKLTAESFGATAEATIPDGVPVTANDVELTRQMAPVLKRAAADGNAQLVKPIMGAEDFSFFANEIPALFFGLGVAADGEVDGAANHSPYFYVNDKALSHGVKAMSSLALEWLHSQQ